MINIIEHYILTISIAAIVAGFVLDLILGDPKGWPHIVRFFGRLIALFEKALYPLKNKRFSGGILVIAVCIVSIGVPAILIYIAWIFSPWAYFVLETLFIWQCLAMNCLRSESMKVYHALKNGDLPAARTAVSMIVGRDIDSLDEQGVTRAAVETVAENTSDGVIAPLFFIMLFGGLGGCLYKAINTMDSMIGYKNEHYIDFGQCAAKLDDYVNYIPARLCAFFMIAAAKLCGLDAKNTYKIWKRDRRNHASPNSAQTESAAAGALGVRLAGNAYYKGVLFEKPFIGDARREIECEDIRRVNRLMYIASILMFLLVMVCRGLIWYMVYNIYKAFGVMYANF